MMMAATATATAMAMATTKPTTTHGVCAILEFLVSSLVSTSTAALAIPI